MNPFDIMKNAQKIQEQMGVFQEKLGTIVVTGSAGGGLVEVDMNGKMELMDIRLASEIVDPSDIEMLQDLIKAAFSNAMEKVKETIGQEMGAMTGMPGGIPIMPGGFPGMGM
jgi:DNA-binding YbaB/EbfC family protein